MLHIYNGDSTANTARSSTIPGEHFAFRESLITGPTPAGLAVDDWLHLRAGHLAEAYGGTQDEIERDLRRQEEILATYREHDEVVLWFEHDLFCQLHLISLLNWFSTRDLRKTKLTLVCVDKFPGIENFRGLGELNPIQLASLLDARHEITPAEFASAAAAWAAYCAPEPDQLEQFPHDNSSPLPFLVTALRAHLARFPSVQNGLGRIEQVLLTLVHQSHKEFTDLFSRFGEQQPIYGFGDSQVHLTLKSLSAGRVPLLTQHGYESGSHFSKSSFEITGAGLSVLQSEADFVQLNGIDGWLGGVRLAADDYWRWDETKQKIVRG